MKLALASPILLLQGPEKFVEIEVLELGYLRLAMAQLHIVVAEEAKTRHRILEARRIEAHGLRDSGCSLDC